MADLIRMAPTDAARSPEEITIDAVMEAAEVAFGKRSRLTVGQVCDLCCGLVAFLEVAQGQSRSMADWKTAIETLHFSLGKKK